MDIYMDGPGRMEAARRLRAQDSECALLFVTTSVEHGIASHELQAWTIWSSRWPSGIWTRRWTGAYRRKREYFRYRINPRSEWDEIEILLRIFYT